MVVSRPDRQMCIRDKVMADNEIDDDISLEDLSYWLDEIINKEYLRY